MRRFFLCLAKKGRGILQDWICLMCFEVTGQGGSSASLERERERERAIERETERESERDPFQNVEDQSNDQAKPLFVLKAHAAGMTSQEARLCLQSNFGDTVI